jgi:FAD dependent oxidoreductase TIGR03364
MKKTAIVTGAGIAGLATARSLALKGYKVTIIDRTGKAVGASIRNFGMIWPIGQPDGALYEIAMQSRSIWRQVCKDANIWHDEAGSLHLAHNDEEWQVLQELYEHYKHREYQLFDPNESFDYSPSIVTENLHGSLYSPHEMIVDPRAAIPAIASWLAEQWDVDFIWGRAVTDVAYPALYCGDEEFEADEIYICSGADFETIYPHVFAAAPITKCKLQMMRMEAQQERIGPALCAGLSLLHYKSFAVARSLPLLKNKLEQAYGNYLQHGIHVMVSQNEAGELTIGDSHEYGLTFDPFDKTEINQMILSYLEKFTYFRKRSIVESWNGVYPKLTNGEANLILNPEQGVTIINGLGGAGMTLAFGLCQQLIDNN